jgi:hypothetical protein
MPPFYRICNDLYAVLILSFRCDLLFILIILSGVFALCGFADFSEGSAALIAVSDVELPPDNVKHTQEIRNTVIISFILVTGYEQLSLQSFCS